MDKEMVANMQSYRKERFAVKTKPCRHPLFENDVDVSITFNGYQSVGLELAQHEIPLVIKALEESLVKE